MVSIAFYDSLIACWDAKYTYWAICPSQLDPAVELLFPNPGHPTYPSGHAALSSGHAEILAHLFPRDAEVFRKLVTEAADSRLWAGIHFRADLTAGLQQGKAVVQLLIERAQTDGSQQ